MNDNEKNLDPTADEVEGHAARYKGAVPDEGDDTTEGHGIKYKGAAPEDGDDEGTEGHGVRVRI